jgi:hypothetical protein
MVLQTEADKYQEMISDLLSKPGIVIVDLLEGSHDLIVVVEAKKRRELVGFIVQTLDSLEPAIKDLRFFIGRESHTSILAEVTV